MQAFRGGIDWHDAADFQLAGRIVAGEFHIRMNDFQARPRISVGAGFAGQDEMASDRILFLHIRLLELEPFGAQGSRIVLDDHFEYLAPPSHAVGPGVEYGAAKGDVFAADDFADGFDLAAVFITVGKECQPVLGGLEPHPVQQQDPFGPHSLDILQGIGKGTFWRRFFGGRHDDG